MRTAQHLHLYPDDVIQAKVDTDPLTLTIKVSKCGAPVSDHDFTFFPETLDQALDLGYEIVNAVNEIKKTQRREAIEKDLGEPIDFGESLEANVPFVPFAINDAVEHETAMAEAEAINYKPD